MIQPFGQRSNGRVTRKGIALLLTFWLNLALLPCVMAAEAPEEEHDCCPPTLELQQPDCCEMDAALSDSRGDNYDNLDDPVIISTGHIWPSLQAVSISQHEMRPPDPGNHSPPRHKLYCVYLD